MVFNVDIFVICGIFKTSHVVNIAISQISNLFSLQELRHLEPSTFWYRYRLGSSMGEDHQAAGGHIDITEAAALWASPAH